MDKKEKMMARRLALAVMAFVAALLQLNAQDVRQIQFSDKKYEYGPGKDSITLYLKLLDSDGNRSKDVTQQDLDKYLVVYEDGDKMIPNDRRTIRSLSGGQRIPADYTFSVLVDLSIPEEGKKQIYDAVGKLVDSAPDSCVYLSFFGDVVTPSRLVTKGNYARFKPQFLSSSSNKYFYGALYAKLAEISGGNSDLLGAAHLQQGYRSNAVIAQRARANRDKMLLFVFTEGNKSPSVETLTYIEVTDFQKDASHIAPKVYAFYYTGNGISEDIQMTLQGITKPYVEDRNLGDRQGDFKPADNLDTVLDDFEQVVQDAMYDFAFTYRATSGKVYAGKTSYRAEWKGVDMGEGAFSIGSAETPWPTVEESAAGTVVKFLIAILVTLLAIVFFFCIIKILIPFIKSKNFAAKYYKKYVPDPNVKRRVCHYCKQEIQPGQMVVVKCSHITHVHCWKQAGYKCPEYGQNCTEGIQDHVDWHDLFTKASLRDCYQMVAGVCAGLVSWIVYELLGRGGFTSLAEWIVGGILSGNDEKMRLFYDTAVAKVSAFLTIGALLGFFLSLIFRYNDEYRKKDWRVYLKIAGLSLFSSLTGLLAFALGGVILCLLVLALNTTYMPWYCSFPAYLLFSICFSLSLTVKSTIPMKSALLGGLCSAVIGFIVLSLSSLASSGYGWVNMLLDFIIYGGGLGASLITVRMLAERYFLVIQNGVKAGQKIPIHKWMNATGGGQTVSIGMTVGCEIQMNWEKSNKVAKEHAQLYIDHTRQMPLPVIKPLATGVVYNTRAELPVGKPAVLSNGDTFKIGDTIFRYTETD